LSGSDDHDRQRGRTGGGDREQPTNPDRPAPRIFALGEEDGSAPLAAVFKTRKRRSREGDTPNRPPRSEGNPSGRGERYPLASDPPLDVLDALDEDLDARSPDESFDVLLTEDFRVSSTPPPLPDEPPEPAGPRLKDVIPPDADPVWAREAILGLAAEQSEKRRRIVDGAWYQELFSLDYLKSEPPTSNEQVRTEVDFIESALSLPAQGRVLYLGSG